jgi:hypothetical protein
LRNEKNLLTEECFKVYLTLWKHAQPSELQNLALLLYIIVRCSEPVQSTTLSLKDYNSQDVYFSDLPFT